LLGAISGTGHSVKSNKSGSIGNGLVNTAANGIIANRGPSGVIPSERHLSSQSPEKDLKTSISAE
jgi:hypothetical protein